jgi:hypothetical protein
VSGVVVGWSVVGSWGRSSLSSVSAVIHSPYPTCKQVLAAVGMGGGSALSRDSVWAGFGRVSVTWRAYGGCYVLTGQVAPFWGLPASLCALLACVNNLTSRLNGGGGGLGGRARALRVFRRCRSSLLEYKLKIKRIQLVN